MDGTAELQQLAHLLRVGANTARDIASIRKDDAGDIILLSRQAELMADSLDRIAARPLRDGVDGDASATN